jgi:spoIIIJ-associated protein
MKDQVFTGRDVAEALAGAGRALGLPPDSLRYVVLERGAPGLHGMGGTPARIVVLLGEAGPSVPRDEPAAVPGDPRMATPGDPRAAVRRVLRALADAASLEVDVTLEEDASALRVRLEGAGTGWFLDQDAEVLKAVEHLLQRMFGRQLSPRRLVVDCAGYRQNRDETLRTLARELSAAVRADRAARTTEPLNAYERRIIHVAVSSEDGVRSFSVGEGAGRRVTVAPADASPPPDDPAAD